MTAILDDRRRHPSWGGKKLLALLHKRHPRWLLPGRSAACDILSCHGMVPTRRQRRRIGHPARADHGDQIALLRRLCRIARQRAVATTVPDKRLKVGEEVHRASAFSVVASASHAARCMAFHGVGSYAEPATTECAIPAG